MPSVLEAPPSPPDVFQSRGWGGGRRRPPWQLWVALLFLVGTAAYVSWLGVRAFQWQPVATVISVAWAIAYTSIAERRFHVSPEAREMRIVLWCLVGGFVAQAAQIVVDRRFSIGPLWIAMGILGIGGGFGIGSMALVRAWFFTVTCARLLVRWRAA
jgi:hypothetical protein